MNLDFSNLRILVYGDVMLDEYVHGVIERISPEAPVPVLSRTHSENRPGGAANVAVNAAALGARVMLCGPVGRDEAYRYLLDVIPGCIDIALVYAAETTTCKTRYMAQRNHYALRLDVDGKMIDEDFLAEEIRQLPNDFNAIIVSDYAKGAVTPRTWAALRAKGVPIFVDPKAEDWDLYEEAFCFTPNVYEYCVAQYSDPPKNVLVTRGEHGMTLNWAGRDSVDCPAVAQQVADVTGAGDTVIAAFACAVTAGNDPVDAMRFANAATGVAVSKSGTATVTIAEARAAFEEK